ncbi:hypothetical protein [Nisaea nitritireducens]|uniref:hypothetical protein n=1 Tax=Nisaea nitritireducens TaxID=568392 RepID=UPI00186918ED|nr:hypothetical protein [Nisaea nitritireducens]
MHSGTLKLTALVAGLRCGGKAIPLGGGFQAPAEVAKTLIARGHAKDASDAETPVPAARRARPGGKREPTLKDPEPDNGTDEE